MAILIFLSHIFLSDGRNDDHSQRRLYNASHCYPAFGMAKSVQCLLTVNERDKGKKARLLSPPSGVLRRIGWRAYSDSCAKSQSES
jgi:hypothetical protein